MASNSSGRDDVVITGNQPVASRTRSKKKTEDGNVSGILQV